MGANRIERIRISWIHKPDPDGRTELIGGMRTQGDWSFTLDEAIECLERGKCTFFINHDGREVGVFVGHNHLTGKKYLKTMPDGEPIDNLLSLVKSHE